MSVVKTVIGVSIGIIVLVGVLWFTFEEKREEVGPHYMSDITIERTWKLPESLEEVSGIAHLGGNRIACIQDEDGTIFIYDLSTSRIEAQIDFRGGGDYEGIAVAQGTAYVLESNGTVHKIEDFQTSPRVTSHETPLTGKQDTEGLCYDARNDRLLLAIKEKEPATSDFKGIYALDPQSMEMQEEPIFKLLFRDPVFEQVEEKKQHNKFSPSEININPSNGKIYMLEGTNPKLLILDSNGRPERLRFLDEEKFPQPEGITFDETGKIYISNEGNPATIHLISIEN